MKIKFSTIAIELAVLFVVGCSPQAKDAVVSTAPNIDQASLCEVKDWQQKVVAESCKVGQKVVYLPSSWGNEQLPIMFAAVNCDLRYSVSLTNGGVTCIYAPITLKAT